MILRELAASGREKHRNVCTSKRLNAGKMQVAPPPPYGFCKDVIRLRLEGGGLLRM
jgi:hypothetical protein